MFAGAGKAGKSQRTAMIEVLAIGGPLSGYTGSSVFVPKYTTGRLWPRNTLARDERHRPDPPLQLVTCDLAPI